MINVKVVDEKIVELDLEGEITGEDYKAVKPQLEKLFNERGRMKFLMNLKKARGFNLGAIYQDIKFDLQHLKYIGDTAVVAQKKTYELMTDAINMIYPTAKITHFEENEGALAWLRNRPV